MFKYDYVPPEQLQSFVDLVVGPAVFMVTGWTDKDKDGHRMTTAQGLPRVDIILSVCDAVGQEGKYFDALTPKTNWKLKSLLDCIGLPSLYSPTGLIDLNQLIGRNGKCELKAPNEGYKKLNIAYLSEEQYKKKKEAPIAYERMENKTNATTLLHTKPQTAATIADDDNEIPF
jgi:hypothetical protein